MKKIALLIIVAVTVSLMIPRHRAYAAEKPSVSAVGAVLISADTGEILYSVNCDKKLPMASTTKIMTTLLCLESGNLYEEFTVDSEAIKVEGSSMGLQDGDIVTKYALCCGMLLPSGNDAANAAAVKIAGSIEAFADMMNERARELGLSRTYFVTPSGLDGEGHGSSAYDMAMLAREALKNDIFREICSSESIKLSFGNPPYDRWLNNTNKLLTMYDGVYGVKTGFTDEAGRCLVSACERDGKELICVTLNDKNDWNDHIAMYEYGFSVAKSVEIPIPEHYELDLVGADEDRALLSAGNEPVTVTVSEYDMEDFSFEVLSSPFIYAPVQAGEQLAELRILCDGREVKRVPLMAAADYSVKAAEDNNSKKKDNLFIKIFDKLRGIFS